MKIVGSFAAVISVIVLMGGPGVAAEKTLRLGTTALPPAKGNPYASTSTTTYIFFTALFDSLTQIDDQGVVHPWLALEWSPLTDWSFVAERYQENRSNFWRTGARYAINPNLSVDLSRASDIRRVGAGASAWWTLGLNWAFDR